MSNSRLQPLLSFFVVVAPSVLAGCVSAPRTSYTASEASSARILDLADLRLYADAPVSRFRGDRRPVVLSGPQTYLALPGGGADGAYGSGVLNGWTEAGTRPSFSIVSGVSTGALIAPLRFSVQRTTRHCVICIPAVSLKVCWTPQIR